MEPQLLRKSEKKKPKPFWTTEMENINIQKNESISISFTVQTKSNRLT